MLPHARPGGIAGLLELLKDRGGKEDLYHVAEDLLMEVDDLLPILEAARCSDLRSPTKGDVEITDGRARRLPKPTLPTRKRLFREAALATCHLAAADQ